MINGWMNKLMIHGLMDEWIEKYLRKSREEREAREGEIQKQK